VLNALAYAKPDLNQLYEIEGKKQTVLHYACSFATKEIVEFLIRNGCDVEKFDQDKVKPLDRAMLANNVTSQFLFLILID